MEDGRSGVPLPAGTEDLSLFENFQTGSGSHSVFYLMVGGSYFPGDKAADHLILSSSEAKNGWSYRDNFYLLSYHLTLRIVRAIESVVRYTVPIK